MPMEKVQKHPPGWRQMAHPAPHLGGKAPHHRESGSFERYLPSDPRMDRSVCEHTQVQDIVLHLGLVLCLDCGHQLDVRRDWAIVEEVPPVLDSELTARRRQHNDIWFDKTYKMTPDLPDDPSQEARITKDLKTKGVDRL